MKIIQLPSKNNILDSDYLVIEDGGITYKITAAQLFDYIAGAIVPLQVQGSQATINVEPGKLYNCETLTSLTISSIPNSTIESVIKFKSGTTPTTLSFPVSTDFECEANTKYEINIFGGDLVIGKVYEQA
jgi:hypothetical protein